VGSFGSSIKQLVKLFAMVNIAKSESKFEKASSKYWALKAIDIELPT
jgi:hypothetical protein